jgi:DegT/DnrJ/EryC1/StrS aminotransferase family
MSSAPATRSASPQGPTRSSSRSAHASLARRPGRHAGEYVRAHGRRDRAGRRRARSVRRRAGGRHHRPESLRGAIGDRTLAVVPAHLYGQCSDTDAVREGCSDRNIAVIEDCAQAIGAELRGRPAGTIGTLGWFSFYPTKNLAALGAEEAERHERRAVARLDQRKGSKEHGGAGKQEDRLRAVPTRVRGFDERVDEQDERTGDVQCPGGVVASPRERAPALA